MTDHDLRVHCYPGDWWHPRETTWDCICGDIICDQVGGQDHPDVEAAWEDHLADVDAVHLLSAEGGTA